jgi:hypothetical protein
MRPFDRQVLGSAVVTLALSLLACAPVPSGSAPSSPQTIDLAASSSGVCQARLELPDVIAAERAFTNLAHEALHALAADARLSRATTAGILEAMERSEADFSHQSAPSILAADLEVLQTAADAALTAVGGVVPPCTR